MIKKIVKVDYNDKYDDEIDKLRVSVSMLLLERDNLLFHECKNIEAEYVLEFGKLEYKVYEAECEYRRLKRKLELIITSRNHNEPIDLDTIEEQLEKELEEFYKILNAKLGEIEDAKIRQGLPRLSVEEDKELKSLYRKLIKKLHPDMNPNVTEYEKELFNKVVECYENGNLLELQMIEISLEDKSVTVENSLEEKQRLTKLVDKLNSQIQEIKSTYPYILKETLVNKEKTIQRYKELNEMYDRYSYEIQIYTEEIENFLKEEKMSDIIKKNNDYLRIKYTDEHGLAGIKPFQRDILLFDTHIAGTTHIEGMDELEKHIHIGDRLEFYRQQDNPYDTNAIEIRNDTNVKLGYVPKADNIVFSRLMDAGKLLYGKVISKEILDNWVKIRIEIYLHEI